MTVVLDVQHLSKVYDDGHQALRDVSFTVHEGEFLAVIGLSGAGKSTLIRCINRLVDPSYGKVIYRGVDVTALPTKQLRATRRKIGMVFQHFNLVERRSVLTNVLSGRLGRTPTVRSVAGLFSEQDRRDARRCLSTVGLEDKVTNRADELSGGQKQRVAIARALMQDPDLLLADEPVASLDPATAHSVLDYLRKANEELGVTILCNLHFLSLVREYASRVLALRQGELVYDGDSERIDRAWFKRIYGEDAREISITSEGDGAAG
ncbi:MAG: phosphonate ABC transporter ATP-binding protein [Planctomycetota bacterium]